MIGHTLLLVLMLNSYPASFWLVPQKPIAHVRSACNYSDEIYANDAKLMRLPEAPTHFRLMISRYVEMVQAAKAYPCTGTVTVGFDGHQYLQTGHSDDAGIMELIPTLSRLLNIPLGRAYDATILAVILCGLAAGYCGFVQLFPSAQSRWLGIVVFVCIGLAEARVADEYIFQSSPLVAGLPWLLHYSLTRRTFALTTAAIMLAFCCSWCALVRTGTVVICMTFLFAMFLLRKRKERDVLALALCFLACIPASLFERSLVARRNTAFTNVGEHATAQDNRPLWHTFYIGLGFVKNSEVPAYRDEVARDKVRSINASVAYTSTQYETILRHEIWSLLKRKPLLVLGILVSKALIVLLLCIILLFPARRFIFSEMDVMWIDRAFLLTMGMSAVNSIVALPRLAYLLTFCSLAVIYSSFKVSRKRAQILA